MAVSVRAPRLWEVMPNNVGKILVTVSFQKHHFSLFLFACFLFLFSFLKPCSEFHFPLVSPPEREILKVKQDTDRVL